MEWRPEWSLEDWLICLRKPNQIAQKWLLEKKKFPQPIFHECLSRSCLYLASSRHGLFCRLVQLRRPRGILTKSHFHKISKYCWTLATHQPQGWVPETDEKGVSQIPKSSHSSQKDRSVWRVEGCARGLEKPENLCLGNKRLILFLTATSEVSVLQQVIESL